jgi:hypothetical protein
MHVVSEKILHPVTSVPRVDAMTTAPRRMSFYSILQQFSSRVARWFVFKPKIPIWVNFVGYCFGKFYDHLIYFKPIGNMLWPFAIFCGNLVCFSPFRVLDQEKSGNPVQYVVKGPLKRTQFRRVETCCVKEE